MDYEKKYKETLERAKQLLRTSVAFDRFTIERVFPELKENKKEWIEKIRQELKSYLEHREVKQISESDAIQQWIAWLEKQGKQKSTGHNENEEPQVYETNDGDVVTYSETNGYKVIEPKFKVGDWISNDMCDVHIASIENGMYYFDEGDGLSIVFVDEHYHIWTIEDAMDGDVLHTSSFTNDCIFIFDKLDNWKFDEPNGERAVATGHCCLTLSANNMEFSIQGPDCIEVDTVKPATKIQRDLLFKKMKESGYEFDFETKELKKIENDLTEFENALADVCRGWIGEELGWKDYIIKNSLPLLEFAKKQFDEYEQKPAWSEEDEKRLNFCLNILRPKTLFGNTEISNIDTINTKWLKSLKDRIQPHKQWKPSEEQIKAFEHFVRSIGESGYASLYENNTKLLYSLLEQLKKL